MGKLATSFVVAWLATSLAVAQSVPASPSSAPSASACFGASSRAHKSVTIVLVMESSGGVEAAAQVRQALNQAGCTVVSLGEAQRRAIVPDALLTVAIDRMRTVQVVYWLPDGSSDALSALGPAKTDQLQSVLVALGSALIRRHRNVHSPIAREVLARARMFDDPRASRAIYAMLGEAGRLLPRTNVFLRSEDF